MRGLKSGVKPGRRGHAAYSAADSSCSWVPDAHTFLACVSGNFLLLCHSKCLERCRPPVLRLQICSVEEEEAICLLVNLKIGILLNTCWYLLSFPSLGAAPKMLCWRRIFGKLTEKFTALCLPFHFFNPASLEIEGGSCCLVALSGLAVGNCLYLEYEVVVYCE